MIHIKNARTLEGLVTDVSLPSENHQRESHQEIDAKGRLTLFPALIDPHVHFRVPGAEHKEDWRTAAQAALAGGVTTVFDMPNNNPACVDRKTLHKKKQLIDSQLKEIGIPLRYYLYLGADEHHLDEIGFAAKEVIGIKVYMGSTTGNLLMANDKALDRVFQMAAQENLVVSVHAEDEQIISKNKEKYKDSHEPSIHSKIRDRHAAAAAVKKAIGLAEKYGSRLVILHVSTKEELDWIREAKTRELLVYCEVTPHHLFLTEADYDKWGTKVQMNPPLRTLADQEALWNGILDDTIDMIGSDHAPHTLEEKNNPYGIAPSGVPGIETTLPLLLTAYHEKKITLEKIISLTHTNIINIFELKPNQDAVLVDLEKTKKVTNKALKTKCGWSPYEGWVLKGWPVYTILQGKAFHVES
jgi:dihydroorotase